MQVKLSKLPDPKSLESVSVGSITGGLNIKSEPDDCAANQSPDMENMWYANGCLRKRWGMGYIGTPHTDVQVQQSLWYDRLFNGKLVWLRNDKFYCAAKNQLASPTVVKQAGSSSAYELPSNCPVGRFVPFEEYLFYKTKGAYIRLKVDDTTNAIVAESVFVKNADGTYTASSLCYTPVISINRNPDGTGGDSYQPENRIQPRKTVWFDVDDESLDYYLPVHGVDSIEKIQIDDDYVERSGDNWIEHRSGQSSTITHEDGCMLRGRNITFVNDDVDNNSPLYTAVHLDIPLDPDTTGWGNPKDYRTEATLGNNFTNNIIWSDTDIYPTSDTKFPSATMLHENDGTVPPDYSMSKIDCALDAIGFKRTWPEVLPSMTETYCVFDDGDTCSVVVFPPSTLLPSEGQEVLCMDQTEKDTYIGEMTSENFNKNGSVYYRNSMRFKNCNVAVYDYATEQWTIKRYSGTAMTDKFYTTHNVYTTFNVDFEYNPKGVLFGPNLNVIKKGLIRNILRATKSPLRLAQVAAALHCTNTEISYDATEIPARLNKFYVSESSTTMYFRFDLYGHEMWVTGMSADEKFFGMYAYVNVAIDKKTFEVRERYVSGPSAIGFKAENITYSSFDIEWRHCYPPYSTTIRTITDGVETSEAVSVTGLPIVASFAADKMPSTYASEIYYARMKAKEASSDGTIHVTDSSKVFVLESERWNARGYWFICEENGVPKVEVTEWNSDTTEIKLKGVVTEYRNTAAKKIETEVDLTTPASLSNRLRVTYSKYNADAFKAIADCKVATDYGGSDSVCIAMGNCDAQPNALFWSGNGSAGVDPCYFPMDQYNLVGAYQDPITDLAKWQSYLIILQEHRTSKGSYSIESNSATGRNFIDIPVSTINPEIGCDRPRTVQLCSNNLVWADSKYGVLYLNDTSYANENAIIPISGNINGSRYRQGLLKSMDAQSCISMDDGKRYYLIAGKQMWVWDYSLSSLSENGVSGLSWTKHILPKFMSAATVNNNDIYFIDIDNNIVNMGEDYDDDLGDPIACHYTTPTQTFGGYYKLRNIAKIILKCSTVKGGRFMIRYGGERSSNPANEMDVALKSSQPIRLPAREFDTGIVLKPRMLHIQNFYFRIESDGNDGGLAIDNALILYTSQGVTR